MPSTSSANRSFLLLTVKLPKGVTAGQARAAIRRTLKNTPERIVRTAVEDSLEVVPMFSGKNPSGLPLIARS